MHQTHIENQRMNYKHLRLILLSIFTLNFLASMGQTENGSMKKEEADAVIEALRKARNEVAEIYGGSSAILTGNMNVILSEPGRMDSPSKKVTIQIRNSPILNEFNPDYPSCTFPNIAYTFLNALPQQVRDSFDYIEVQLYFEDNIPNSQYFSISKFEKEIFPMVEHSDSIIRLIEMNDFKKIKTLFQQDHSYSYLKFKDVDNLDSALTHLEKTIREIEEPMLFNTACLGYLDYITISSSVNTGEETGREKNFEVTYILKFPNLKKEVAIPVLIGMHFEIEDR